jgi:hypothetical protein
MIIPAHNVDVTSRTKSAAAAARKLPRIIHIVISRLQRKEWLVPRSLLRLHARPPLPLRLHRRRKRLRPPAETESRVKVVRWSSRGSPHTQRGALRSIVDTIAAQQGHITVPSLRHFVSFIIPSIFISSHSHCSPCAHIINAQHHQYNARDSGFQAQSGQFCLFHRSLMFIPSLCSPLESCSPGFSVCPVCCPAPLPSC